MQGSVLQKELKMSRPFDCIEQEVYLNLHRTHSILTVRNEHLFKDAGVTSVQYNVLRILRGADNNELPSQEIASRMIARVPDITCLVDRLVRRKLVIRQRSQKDRRVVYVKLRKEGFEILANLDEAVVNLHKSQFTKLTKKELLALNVLLVKYRDS